MLSVCLSHPMWVRGLKLIARSVTKREDNVAPHVGAWIETPDPQDRYGMMLVAPHVGAWIETADCQRLLALLRVAPHVGAWIET